MLPDPVARAAACSIGERVAVTPVDYGRVPVTGELLCADAQQIVLRRHTEETGTIASHFPRAGFELVPDQS